MTTWRRRLTTSVADDQLLYTLADDYVTCLRAAGLMPVLLPHVSADDGVALLDLVDGLVVTGGQDVDPAQYGQDNVASRDTDAGADRSDTALLRAAASRRVPTLGICRGLQILNVAFGGTLLQEVTSAAGDGVVAHPTRPADKVAALAYRHTVEFVAGSRIADAYGRPAHRVTSLHHQGVDRTADDLVVTAHAPDGLAEGLEARDPRWWCVAVQWHPEKMGGEDAPLFDAYADRVRAVAGDRS